MSNLLILPLLGGVLVLAGDAEDVSGDLQVDAELNRLHHLLAASSGAVINKPKSYERRVFVFIREEIRLSNTS